MTPAFRNLLNRYAMLAFERQLAFFDWLGERDVQPSLKDGNARIGSDTHRLHLLGSRAEETNSWRWAWASEAPQVAKTAYESAKKVRQVGRKRAIAELAEEEFPLDPLDLDAHTMALIAMSVAELPAYEIFPYKGGALFAAIEIPDLQLGDPEPDRLADVLRRVCERLPVEPKIACPSYLEQRGAKLETTKSGLVAKLPDGRSLTVTWGADGGVEVSTGHPKVGAGMRGGISERPGV